MLVWNELGEVQLTARVDSGLTPGTLLIPGIWWAKFSTGRRNVNRLTSQQEADMGSGACFYDVIAYVRPVNGENETRVESRVSEQASVGG